MTPKSNSQNWSCNGASLPNDPLSFSISGVELNSEETAMDALSRVLTKSLGEGNSARISKLGDNYVLNIIQPHTRLSEILPRELSDWIKEGKHSRVYETRNFQIVFPHSIIVNAGQKSTAN